MNRTFIATNSQDIQENQSTSQSIFHQHQSVHVQIIDSDHNKSKMLEVDRSELLQQVSVILQQCQMIVSRLSTSSPVPVCVCQSSTPVQDHNDNYWWDGYTSQLSQFSNEFYSLLSPDYDDLFEDASAVLPRQGPSIIVDEEGRQSDLFEPQP